MDIDLLSKMVKALILDNDRVVLPGLGSFVAEIVPSSFSDKGYTINPPYRKLYFRSKPNEGDALALFYARSNNVDKAMADRILNDYISELKTILYSKKTVILPGLGRLRATKENNIFFVADEDLDIYPDGFGLEPISLKTHVETKEDLVATVEELKSLLGESETSPEPLPEALPVPDRLLETEVLPEPDSQTKPDVESESESESEPEHQLEPEKTETQEDQSEVTIPQKTNIAKIVRITCILIVGIALLLLISLAIIGRTFPEWIDQYLYTQEELRILNHIL